MSIDVIELLIEAGADFQILSPDLYARAPLHEAAIRGHCARHSGPWDGNVDAIDVLLHAGADINMQSKLGDTPLQSASATLHSGVVDALLRVGAAVNIPASDGTTALHSVSFAECDAASEHCRIKIVDTLLNPGAKVDALDERCRSPLRCAACKGHLEVVHKLLLAGADTNSRTDDGHTPLYGASSWGHCDVVDALLLSGADVHATNGEFDRTSLHTAAIYGHEQVASRLLSAGADVNSCDKRRKTPLDYALVP